MSDVTQKEYKHTVLIVDDNPTNLGVLSSYLKEYGLRILVARSGESALRKTEIAKPDVILLDVMMPGLDGFETCKRLKENPQTEDIPVIFMTALADPEDKVKGLRVGAVDYVIKPLHHEEVLARVSTHLNIRALTHNLQERNERLVETTSELWEANESLSKRALQLETSSELARQVTAILDLETLLKQVVHLIQSKFDYYFVGVWLHDDDQLILQAGASAVRKELPPVGHTVVLNDSRSAVAKAYQINRLYLVTDIVQDPHYVGLYDLPQTKAELVLPLRTGQKVIGLLDIQSRSVQKLVQEDKMVMQSMADQIAIAIRNARYYKVEQKRRHMAEALEQAGRVLSSSLELEFVPKQILEQLSNVVSFNRGAVMLTREDGSVLIGVALQGYPDGYEPGELRVELTEGDVFDQIAQTKRPVIKSDVTSEEGWTQLEWLPLNYSWLGVPLISKDNLRGMISMTRAERNAFSTEEGAFALAFAGQAAIALENAGLYDEISRLNANLEQKVAQRTEELRNAYGALERMDKAKTDFIKVTSHELRTPLSVIRGYTQILGTMSSLDNNSSGELLSGIVNGVDRLHKIVNTMLDVVKIDTQVLSVVPEPISLYNRIGEIVSGFRSSINERNLTLIMDSGLETLPDIQADPDLLYKVFYNLVVNAIKYTPDGGTITISGHETHLAESIPSVQITIADTGIGIDPEHQEQIFEKFYQTGEVSLHSTGVTKFKGGGPGLGLAIAQGIVNAHRGKIWVESKGYSEDMFYGSQFHVLLPLKQPKLT